MAPERQGVTDIYSVSAKTLTSLPIYHHLTLNYDNGKYEIVLVMGSIELLN
jgi:hypothetical protein